MASRIKELAEEARVAIRNVRRDANKHADTAEKEKTMSEDDCKQTKDQVQDLTKKYENSVNEKAASKEKEVMEN
jgi:ribosome recycling factor